MVISIALLGIIVAPVLGAIRLAVEASSQARAAANVETALINAVDRVNRADARSNQLCHYDSYTTAAVVTQGWDPSTVETRTEYFDGDLDAWVRFGDVDRQGCPDGTYARGLVQRVTITVTDPGGRISRSIEVVKGDV